MNPSAPPRRGDERSLRFKMLFSFKSGSEQSDQTQHNEGLSLFLPGKKSQNLAGKVVGKSEPGFRAGIKVDGLLIEPYQKGFPDAVLRPGKIVRRMYREFLVLLHCVVVQRQALARNAVRALLRIRKTMKRTFVRSED